MEAQVFGELSVPSLRNCNFVLSHAVSRARKFGICMASWCCKKVSWFDRSVCARFSIHSVFGHSLRCAILLSATFVCGQHDHDRDERKLHSHKGLRRELLAILRFP